jgi:hypothetical protein
LAKKNKKQKNKRPPSRNELDKMSFEKREKIRKKLKQEAVYTRSFKTPQSFGAASNVKILTLEEYIYLNGGNTENIMLQLGIKNEN